MSRYATAAIRKLAQRAIRDLSRVDRLRQIERAEAVAGEVRFDSTYPLRDLCRRIAADENTSPAKKKTTGAEALHDLRCFVEDVSASTELPLDGVSERVWSLDDVSRQFNVSTKTVDRWRDRGLVSRLFRAGGRTRVGFLDSAVRRFARDHAEEIERGRRFSQMDDRQKQDLVRDAERLSRHGISRTEVTRRLAESHGRSPETVRYTLQQHDQQNPERAVFTTTSSPLTAEQKRDLYQKFRRGVDVDRLAKQFGRTKATVYRVVAEVRAEKLLDPPIDFMDSPEFHEPKADATILGPPPEIKKKSTTVRPPAGLPPYLASLYSIPLLTREEEQYWFRKMNYLKFKAAELQKGTDPKRPRAADLDRLEAYMAEATEVKNFLIRSNLRLVVSIAKKYIKPTNNFFEMVSDGNMSLIRAIEKFDYTKGNKFSTYATWAIMKNFARSIPAEHKRLDRFRTGKEEVFQHSHDGRGSQFEEELTNQGQRRVLMDILGQLDTRERDILLYRYGLGEGNEPLTLEQVGARFGVTKERIRQLESRALRKLRKIAEEERVDIPGI